MQYDSYSRIVLSQTKAIAKLLRQYADIEMAENPSFASIKLLSNEDIERALTNPQNSIPLAMHGLAEFIKARTELQDTRDELSFLLTEASTRELDEKIRQELAEVVKDLMQVEQTIHELYQKLFEFIDEQDQEWQKFRQNTLENIAAQLIANNIPLTDFEKSELHNAENWFSVIKRYRELSLPFPSFINIDRPNRVSYFQLKTYLAIHSSLNRRMLSSTENEIKKIWPK